MLPQCNQRKPLTVLEHTDLVALAAALGKGLFIGAVTIWVSAGHRLPLDSLAPVQEERDFILHGVET